MNDLQETNLNLAQLHAINFIVGVFANISKINDIDELKFGQIINENIDKYLEKIPYGKAKALIDLVTYGKDIIKTL